MKTLYQF